MTGRSFRDLIVWQRSMDLAVQVHRLARRLPPEHRFVLAEQMNRAAVSTASNIAEGAGRFGRGEFRHYVSVSLGSVRELETQLLLAVRIDALSREDVAEALATAREVGRMQVRLGHRLS